MIVDIPAKSVWIFLLLFLTAVSFPAESAQSISLFSSGQKHFSKNEFPAALSDWRKAAKEGDVRAMNGIADMYARGAGVKVDYAKALEYWHQAADKGDGDAMYEIAVSYALARGVQRDQDQFKSWFQKALDHCQERVAVQTIVKSGSTADKEKAVECLKKKANDGSYRAMMNLASKDGEGRDVLKNPLEAASWGPVALETMQKKADAGDTQAMYFMGRAFFNGVGDSIPQDAARGLELCEKAGMLGDVEAMNWLITTYLSNDRYKDYKKVASWHKKIIKQYTILANKGDASAMVTLADKHYTPPTGVGADMGKPLEGTKRDADKAVSWAKKAVALGNREALSLLGHIHEDVSDDNPLHDCKKARDYYEKAAALQEQRAIERLAAREKGAPQLSCNF